MSNDKMSRRRFLGATAAAGSTALAGCNTDSGNSEEETSDNQSTDEKATVKDAEKGVSEEEFVESLKSTAFDIQESLSRTHESPHDEEMVELSGDDDYLTLIINEDLGELVRGSTQEYNNADLYIASEFGVADEVLYDAKPELAETAEIVDSELGSLQEEIDVPEGYDVRVQIDIEGRRETSASSNWEYGGSTAESELEELYEDVAESGKGEPFAGLGHGQDYDGVLTLSAGESQTVNVNGVEHTVEYVETVDEGTNDQSGVLKINGELENVGNFESLSIGEENYRTETNPVYVQDREEVEDGIVIRGF